MSRVDLERLLWEQADGPLDEADRRRLERLLASTAGAEALRAEVRAVGELLADLPPASPPQEMYESIQTALGARSRERARRPVRSAWWEGLGRWLAAGWRVRYAYALAGVLLGVVAASLVSPSRSQRYASTEVYYVGALSGRPIAAPGLGLGGGAVTLWRDGQVVVARLGSGEPRGFEVSFEQPGRRLSFEHRERGPVEIRFAVVEGSLLRVRLASPGGAVEEREIQIEEIPAR